MRRMTDMAGWLSSLSTYGRMASVAFVLILLIGACAALPSLALSVSNGIRRVLELIAKASAWLLIVLMFTTLIDVVFRKMSRTVVDLGINFPYTKFQEFEWHLHAAIFSLWMGYNYVINAHPRVDSYFSGATLRQRAWVEFLGCLLFAIPYCCIVTFYGWEWIKIAYVTGEASDSANGLTHRWIIKGVYYVGLWLLLIGVLSVTMRLAAHLFGGKSVEKAELNLGSSQLEV
jgi:TRAP-type mannitol/chloroaromatic compound transport system permease small subunit